MEDKKFKLAGVAIILALVAGRFYERWSGADGGQPPPVIEAVEPEPVHEIAMPPGLVGDRWELPEVRDSLSLMAFSAWLQSSQQALVDPQSAEAGNETLRTELQRISQELDAWRMRLARRALDTMRRQYDVIGALLRNEVLDSRLVAADRAELGAFAKAVKSRQEELEESHDFNATAFQNMAQALGKISRSLEAGTEELKSQSLVNFQESLQSLLGALSSAQPTERDLESPLTLLIGSSKRYHRTANLDSWTLHNQARALDGFRFTDSQIGTIRSTISGISGSLQDGSSLAQVAERLDRLKDDLRVLRADLESRFFENLQVQLDVLNLRDRNLRELKIPLQSCVKELEQFVISERNVTLLALERQVPEVVDTLNTRSLLFEEALLGNLGSQLEAIRFHLESHLYEMDQASLERFQAHLSKVGVGLEHEALSEGGGSLKALLAGLNGQLSRRLSIAVRNQRS